MPLGERALQFPAYFVLTTIDLAVVDLTEHLERWRTLMDYSYTSPFGDMRWRNPQLTLKIEQRPKEVIERAIAIILLQNGLRMYMAQLAMWWGPVDCGIAEIFKRGRMSGVQVQKGRIRIGKSQDLR